MAVVEAVSMLAAAQEALHLSAVALVLELVKQMVPLELLILVVVEVVVVRTLHMEGLRAVVGL